jgi:hypothetical protein
MVVVLVVDTSGAAAREVVSAEPLVSQADPCILGGDLRASQAELARYQWDPLRLRGQIRE